MGSRRSIDGLLKCIIMGPPGSGKGTVAARILKHFPMVHISCGDHLRAHIRRKTKYGIEAYGYITRGNLVPDRLVSEIMASEISHHAGENWLLDGFPRTVAQANFLQTLDGADTVIELKVPFEVIVNRLKARWIHAASGRIYNLDFNPPLVPGKDDVTSEDLTQREDDKPETVMQRLKNYTEWEQPVADFYSGLGLLHKFVGTETNQIWPHVYEYLAEKVPAKQAMING